MLNGLSTKKTRMIGTLEMDSARRNREVSPSRIEKIADALLACTVVATPFVFLVYYTPLAKISLGMAWKELLFFGVIATFYFQIAKTQFRDSLPIVVSLALFGIFGLLQLATHSLGISTMVVGMMPYIVIVVASFIGFHLGQRSRRYLLWSLAIFLCLAALGLFYDYLTEAFRYLTLKEQVTEERGFVIVGEFIRPGFLFSGSTAAGANCVLAISLALLVGVALKDRKNSFWLVTIAYVAGVAACLITQSRTAYVGVFLLTGGFIWYYLGYSSAKAIWLGMGALAVLVLFIGFLSVSDVGNAISTRFVELGNSRHVTDDSNIQRVEAWKRGAHQFLAHPFLGIGIGVANVRNSRNNVGIDHFESSVLGMAAEIGIVGLCCFAPYFYWIFEKLSRGKSQNKRLFFILTGIAVPTLTLFAAPFQGELSVTIFVGLILGVGIALNSGGEEQASRIRNWAPSRPPSVVSKKKGGGR